MGEPAPPQVVLDVWKEHVLRSTIPHSVSPLNSVRRLQLALKPAFLMFLVCLLKILVSLFSKEGESYSEISGFEWLSKPAASPKLSQCLAKTVAVLV